MQNKRHEKINLFSILFLFLLFLGLFSSLLLEDKAFSSQENRYLAQSPKFSLKKAVNAEYMNQIDSYLTDQFVGRNLWITLKTNSERYIFQKYVTNDVYFAKNNYLINRYTEKDIDRKQLQKNVSYLNDFQKKYNADVALIPTSSEILTSYLPTPFEQLDMNQLLAEAHTTIPVDTLLANHSSENIYYHTDHHWTLLGAYYIYQAYVSQPVSYDPITITNSFRGTIAKKTGNTTLYDSMEQQSSNTRFQVTFDNQPVIMSSLYMPSYLNMSDSTAIQDPYSYYLDGNHGITHISNETLKAASTQNDYMSPEDKKSILVIKDSFANTFATLLCENYPDVYLIDLRHYNGSISTFIEENEIEQVLFLYNKINFVQDKNLMKLVR